MSDYSDFNHDDLVHHLDEIKQILEELLQQNPHYRDLEAYINDAETLIHYFGDDDDQYFEDAD